MENNEIIITHLVNPHYFYFRWAKDECHDEELSIMEKKIESIATKTDVNSNVSDGNSATSTNTIVSTSSDPIIKVGDVVGVFVPYFHKYIRAAVREANVNGHYSVWAIDYGFPIVAKASNVFKLPRTFQGMHIKNKRIYKGGMENVMPAEMNYCVMAQSGVKEIVSNWAEKSIEVLKNVLKTSGKIKFEHVSQHTNPIDKKPHYFGRLMIQRPDNQMVNAVKCLLDMNCACLTEGIFAEEIKKIETIDSKKQKNYKVGDQFWDTQLTLTSTKLDNVGSEANPEPYEAESDEIKDNMTEYMSDNEYFDDSVSMMQPKLLGHSNGGKNQPQTKCETPVKDEAKPKQENKTSTKGGTNISNNSSQQTPTTVVRRNIEYRNTPPDRNKVRNDQRQYNQRTPPLFPQQHQQFPQQHQQFPQQHQQFPQQHQHRGPFHQPNSSQGNLFSRPPLQFNEPPYHTMPNQFNRQQGGRRRQVRNKNSGSRSDSGEFAASIGHRPLGRINENSPIASPNFGPGPMKDDRYRFRNSNGQQKTDKEVKNNSEPNVNNAEQKNQGKPRNDYVAGAPTKAMLPEPSKQVENGAIEKN
ncbi:component of gems protein 1-like [Contarinia nasturtii]|uniref:component of gems protein 1-like n=1 Tax=Contarinia nasturtii TaxID=265458 RepID=UPI0012D3E987|nr:component of gems protein 1-like [Contarinia nasturtii]